MIKQFVTGSFTEFEGSSFILTKCFGEKQFSHNFLYLTKFMRSRAPKPMDLLQLQELWDSVQKGHFIPFRTFELRLSLRFGSEF